MSKQILIPVSAPWEIELATPRLSLQAFESASDPPVTVGMWVERFDLMNRSSPNNKTVQTIEWRTARIKVTFERGIASRLCFGVSDAEAIREEDYDWSRIPVKLERGESLDAYVIRYDNWCAEHGQCPDPRMYEVANSDWLEMLSPDLEKAGFRHFMLLGHDAYVEVVAMNWSWEECPKTTPPG